MEVDVKDWMREVLGALEALDEVELSAGVETDADLLTCKMHDTDISLAVEKEVDVFTCKLPDADAEFVAATDAVLPDGALDDKLANDTLLALSFFG